MKRINYPEVIKESEAELKQQLRELNHPKLRERCEVLIWLKSGQVKTMKAAMSLKGRSTYHGNKLWKRYQADGLKSFLSLGYRKVRSPLADKEALENRLNEKGFSTIKEAQLWILQTYGLKYTENGLGNYFRNRKIKLKTGRPHHPKKDEALRMAYKKL